MLWSWILTIVGVTGFVLAGRKVWWAWYINIACQALWLTYAIVTSQYGFIVGAAVYTVVFSQNAIRWTKEHYSPSNRMLYAFKKEFDPVRCLHHPERTEDLVGITDIKTGDHHYLCQPCCALFHPFKIVTSKLPREPYSLKDRYNETPEAQS